MRRAVCSLLLVLSLSGVSFSDEIAGARVLFALCPRSAYDGSSTATTATAYRAWGVSFVFWYSDGQAFNVFLGCNPAVSPPQNPPLYANIRVGSFDAETNLFSGSAAVSMAGFVHQQRPAVDTPDMILAGNVLTYLLDTSGALAVNGWESWRPIIELFRNGCLNSGASYVTLGDGNSASWIYLKRLIQEHQEGVYDSSGGVSSDLTESQLGEGVAAGLRQAGVDGISTGSWNYEKPSWGKPLPTVSESVLESRVGEFPEIEDEMGYGQISIPVFSSAYTFSWDTFASSCFSSAGAAWVDWKEGIRLAIRGLLLAGILLTGLIWVFKTLRQL